MRGAVTSPHRSFRGAHALADPERARLAPPAAPFGLGAVCYHRSMLRSLPLLPTLLGVNLWLIALLVPLLLGRATASGLLWAVAPLAPLALLTSLGLRRYRFTPAAQMVLIVGVPLLTFLPTAEGTLASAKLHSPAAVVVQLAVLVAYLAAVCAELARGPQRALTAAPDPDFESAAPAGILSGPGPGPGPGPSAEPPAGWHSIAAVPTVSSGRLRRRIGVYRLLFGMSVVVPLLFLYAINWHPENVRALHAGLGSPGRAAAMQASLTAGATMSWSVMFHFFFMAPMDAHLDHDRGLRSRLLALRATARRGRPRVNLYLAIVLALLSMGLLIWWSL